jgi:hypothetical protein
MLDYQDITNIDDKGIPFTVRSVFISESHERGQRGENAADHSVDPKQTIRLTLTYRE